CEGTILTLLLRGRHGAEAILAGGWFQGKRADPHAVGATRAAGAKAPRIRTDPNTMTFRAPADAVVPNAEDLRLPYDLIAPFRVECVVGLCDPAFYPA